MSVRDAAEAEAAIAGGADVIDMKEPSAGALGPVADPIRPAILAAVGDRAPVTAAAGEMLDLDTPGPGHGRDGLAFEKYGLAGTHAVAWEATYRELIRVAARQLTPTPILAAYADHHTARSPEPEEVLEVVAACGAPWVLIDTFEKGPAAGSLIDTLNQQRLQTIVTQAERLGLNLAMAGKLTLKDVDGLAGLLSGRPISILLGVRGAACRGDRSGVIDRAAVERLAAAVRSNAQTSAPTPSTQPCNTSDPCRSSR